jgi:general secretion pathway protein J
MTSCTRSHGRKNTGFTLLEVMLALTLLALMMGMIYASLNIGLRAWDAGDKRVTAASNWRTVEHFMRRELGQVFPSRWRGVPTPYVAFEGTATTLRYVTTLNLDAALQNGAAAGLQWAELRLNGSVLTLNRQAFDSQAQNFEGLLSGSTSTGVTSTTIAPVKLMDNMTSLSIEYFGQDNDNTDPTWRSEWLDLQRLPSLVRFKIETTRGRDIPDMVVSIKVGEEAGCMLNNFTRQCGPRPR